MSLILEFRPATKQERLYADSQSYEIQLKTGFRGWLRGEFDRAGESLQTEWFDACFCIEDKDFPAEIDSLIQELGNNQKYQGILSCRKAMSICCHSVRESAMNSFSSTTYVFRADTAELTCILELNPIIDDYNLFLFCYEKKRFASHLLLSANGIRILTPDYAEKFRIPDGEYIRMIRPDGRFSDQPVRYVDNKHIAVGYDSTATHYHICEFADYLEAGGINAIPLRSSLPLRCYSLRPTSGEIILIVRGENKRYHTSIPDAGKELNRKIVELRNRENGVSKAQQAAMEAGVVFGWDAPAANPKNYDADGKLLI